MHTVKETFHVNDNENKNIDSIKKLKKAITEKNVLNKLRERKNQKTLNKSKSNKRKPIFKSKIPRI